MSDINATQNTIYVKYLSNNHQKTFFMKIITISKVGYNKPATTNWAYGIWKIDLIDTEQSYCMSHTVRETFGGDSRLSLKVQNELKYTLIKSEGVYTATGFQEITGVTKMLDIESKEVFEIIKEFLTK